MSQYDSETMENCDDLYACNHTELLQLCNLAGVQVLPSVDKEMLIAALEGTFESLEENPIHMWRRAIMKYLLERWSRASSQIKCPAKDGDPNACFRCVDAQVVHCITINPKVETVALYSIRKRG